MRLFILLAAVMLLSAACAGRATEHFAPDTSSVTPELPALDALPEFAPRQASAALRDLLEGDVVLSRKASWDSGKLTLDGGGELAYAIFAVPDPGDYTALQIGGAYQIHYNPESSDRLVGAAWAAVSDYGAGKWRWLGELDEPRICATALAGELSSSDVIYLALVTTDSFTSKPRFSYTDATMLPPLDLPAEVNVPEEIAAEYAELLVYLDEGGSLLQWINDADMAGRRAVWYYYQGRDRLILGHITLGGIVNVPDSLAEVILEVEAEADADLTSSVYFSRQYCYFYFNRLLNPGEQAWYGDQFLLAYPETVSSAGVNSMGRPPPG